LSYSILAMLVLAIGSLAWVAKSGSRIARVLRTFKGAAIGGALYSALAWLYVFEFPVPTPNVEILEPVVGDVDAERFYEFYEIGYRIGVLSTGPLPDYYFGRSEALGAGVGLALGEMEWRGLFPPVTRSAYAWMLAPSTSPRGASRDEAAASP
jgi:hypothetical protein